MTVHMAPTSRVMGSWWVVPALILVLGGTLASNHESELVTALGAVLAGLATVALIFVSRHPVAAVFVTATLVGLYFGLDFADGPVFLIVPGAVFLLAVQRPGRRWAPVAAAAVVLVAAGLVVRGLWWEDALEKSLWQSLAMAGIAAAAGAAAATVGSRRQAAADRAQRAAAEEQLQMAQDLHDGVGHGLAVIAMQSGVTLHLLDKEDIDRVAARRAVQAIRDASRESLEALRAELSRLSPGATTPRGPRHGLADLDVLLDRVRAGGLAVSVEGRPGPMPDAVDEAAYVIVQEALTNVLRHASAARAVVDLGIEPDALVVSITDDGNGGDVIEGLGITGMRARAERLGGTLQAGQTTAGFQVRAVLPLGAET